MATRGRIGDYLTVKAAATLLGVCSGTLCNWDRAGKLRPTRHPMNGYRLYRRSDLEAVLASAAGECDPKEGRHHDE